MNSAVACKVNICNIRFNIAVAANRAIAFEQDAVIGCRNIPHARHIGIAASVMPLLNVDVMFAVELITPAPTSSRHLPRR